MLIHSKLKGHRAAVLCLDISSSSSLLLSGSEDGTARLWDLREHQRRGACLCIQTIDGGDVLSAVFAPPHPQRQRPSTTTTTSSSSSSSSSFAQDYTVYLGVENTVLEYDLRNATSPILSEPTNNWDRILQNQDEVNQIGLAYYNNNNSSKNNNNNNNNIARNKNKKNQKKKKKGGGGGNKKQQHQQHSNHQRTDHDGDDNDDGNDGSCIEGSSLYLAACDDAGKIRYTETTTSSSSSSNYSYGNNSSTTTTTTTNSSSSTILHHDEHGVAVVTTCAFRPNSKQLELISGGTDCKIQLWDILRPKKPISTFLINNQNDNIQGKKPQVCNPPFVYSLAWSNNGEKIAGGLGDGTIGIFEINNRTLIQSQLLIGRENGNDNSNNNNNDGSGDSEIHYAHNSSVVSVVFPSFSTSTDDRILCSAGTDGSIVFWDLGISNDEQWATNSEEVEEENYLDGDGKNNKLSDDDVVGQLFHPKLLRGLKNHTTTTTTTTDPTTMNTKHNNHHKPTILFDIPHEEKINWVTKATRSSSIIPTSTADLIQNNDTIFVADVSPDITCYKIPF